jgi:hypothetical protein
MGPRPCSQRPRRPTTDRLISATTSTTGRRVCASSGPFERSSPRSPMRLRSSRYARHPPVHGHMALRRFVDRRPGRTEVDHRVPAPAPNAHRMTLRRHGCPIPRSGDRSTNCPETPGRSRYRTWPPVRSGRRRRISQPRSSVGSTGSSGNNMTADHRIGGAEYHTLLHSALEGGCTWKGSPLRAALALCSSSRSAAARHGSISPTIVAPR